MKGMPVGSYRAIRRSLKSGDAVTDVIRAVKREIDIMGDIVAASDELTRGVKLANV